jgi:hypothetical protein
MAFPFLAPLKEWTTKKLEAREANKEALNTLMPFVVLSSAAVVTRAAKSDIELKSIYKNKDYGSFDYKGCVVANSTDILKNYQLGNTLVGYDLDGKPIEVEGETNRRVSMPIIESVEIDTDGGNNTLKTAQVKIRVFTLKQLEMFELFFLRPTMRVVLEYGWNSGIRNKVNILTYMFANKSHTDYLKKFIEIFSHQKDAYRIAKGNYLKTLEQTEGEYDFMAGVVTNFNYSPAADGTYDISLEISAGNELQMWMPVRQSKESNKTDTPSNSKTYTPYETWVNQLMADTGNDTLDDTFLNKKLDWENEFFNWGAINITQKDTTFSKEAYISFKLILKIISEMKIYKESEHMIWWHHYEDAAKQKPIIPISSNSIIISPTSDFILPGKLPYIGIDSKKKGKDAIFLDEKIKEDCSIHKKEFNLSYEVSPAKISIYDDTSKEIKVPATTGNLLNVYFNYNTFISVYNNAYSAADIINSLLDTINANMYGLCKLQLQTESDISNGSPLMIVDRKLKTVYAEEPIEKIFRFKIGALNSIVKEFSFNMELSTLMQAQALYASQLAISSITLNTPSGSVVAVNDPYAHADLSYAKNADGFYSVNAVEIEIVKDSEEWNKHITKIANVVKKAPEPTDGEEEIENAADVRGKNFIRFKKTPTDTKETPKAFIYTDASLIQSKIPKTSETTETTALTYLDITLAIDGLAGISCGEYFLIDGVPEIYNQNGYFQVTNVKQGIDSNGWKTTIEAGYRINAKKPETK